MQKLTKFKVIFDLFTVCVYFIQQQNCKLYYIYLMIISEIQSEIGHCSCDSAKFKAPADFSHHAILCMTLSLNENRIPIVRSQMRLGLKIHCFAVYSGTGCVKCEKGRMPKSMSSLVFLFTVSFFY